MKYGKKEFMENIENLTSPFEKVGNQVGKQNGQNSLAQMAQKIKDIINKNKGIK